MASDIRDGETIFRNVCAGCHVRGGTVVLKGSKSLKLSDLEKRGISDENSIAKIANEGIGFMKGYKNKLKDGEDKVLAQWIIQNVKEGWEQMKSVFFFIFLFLLAEFSFAEELTNYVITSDSQVNTLQGDLKAMGNVVIKSNSGNFEAYSDKLSFDKDDKSLKLLGYVYVQNLESYGISIEETSGDQLTIFTDTGLFEFKSQNNNRVKTKIKF